MQAKDSANHSVFSTSTTDNKNRQSKVGQIEKTPPDRICNINMRYEKFLHNKNSKILIITLVILTVMSVFSHNGSNIFSGAVNTVTKGLSTLTAGAASSDKSKEELEKENEQLKKENAELREQLVDYLDAKEENAKLWKYYELKKENPSYDILPAGVLRRDANDDFYSFTLDKGSTDNVEKMIP